MWDWAEDKLHQVSSLDKGLGIFGSEVHHYRLRPPVSESQLGKVEEVLGIELPEELASFYRRMGNGGAGPGYGICTLERLHGFKPDVPFAGVDQIRLHATDAENEGDSQYFEVPHELLSGLLAIIDMGCGHETCLISSGPKVGEVVHVSCDGFVQETAHTLVSFYREWLDHSLEALERVKGLLNSDLSMQDINRVAITELGIHSGRELAVSIMGAQKPVSIFGTRSARKNPGPHNCPGTSSNCRSIETENHSPKTRNLGGIDFWGNEFHQA